MVRALDWSEVGARVREARLARGMSQDRLAEALGLDRTMVTKIESGTRHLDALELGRLADALSLSMSHFIRPRPAVLSNRMGLIDESTTEAGREEFQINAELAEWLRDVWQLIELGTLHPRPLAIYPKPVADRAAARSAARWLRDRHLLGDDPLGPMTEVCQQAGQVVAVVDVPGDGASAIDGDVAVAVVSGRADPGRRRATAAHELGHLVLGDAYSTDLGVSTSRREIESLVDTFAAELLLPTSAVKNAWADHDGTDLKCAALRLAARYRVSWSLLLHQAEYADVIDRDTKRTWAARTPTRAEFREAVGFEPEPDLASIRVSADVLRAAMAAWRSRRISSSRLGELTRGQIDPEDLPDDPDGDVL